MPQDTIAKLNFHGICGVSNDWFKSYLSSDRIVIKIYFFNWDSLHTSLNNHETAWSYIQEKEAQKRLKHTGNLFRKNLQLTDVC